MGEESAVVVLGESELRLMEDLVATAYGLYRLNNGPDAYHSLYESLRRKIKQALGDIELRKEAR